MKYFFNHPKNPKFLRVFYLVFGGLFLFFPQITFSQYLTVFNIDERMLSSLSPKCINLVKKAQQDNSHLTGAIIEHGGCEGNSLYLYTAIRCQEKWQEKITLYRRNINLDMMNLRKYCSRSLGDLGVDLSYIPQHFTVSERQEKQIYKDAQMQKIRDEGHKDLMKDLENLKPEKNYYQ